ncbi:hypothetical protein, partial [Escherichia coli]|uniref:hypothetical protein n=1 Tax=Escherichia coli TaxID=562 RepID=UPI0039E073E8
GAIYRDPQEAVELAQPATKLTLVIEGVRGSEMVQYIISRMRTQTLAEIIADPRVEEVYRPLYERHLRSIDIIRSKASCEDQVISFDL